MPEKSIVRIMSEDAYLAAEEKGTVRHEYVKGRVFAMPGSSDAHNVVCGNLFSFIHSQLRDSQCRAYMNDMKVRIETAKSYYYPDIAITCESFEAKSVFKCSPVILIEVLSPSTAQIDRREKLIAYQAITSLQEYLLVSQDRQMVELYRRISGDDWELFVLGVNDELVLQSFPQQPLQIPFSIIYENYNPPIRIKEDQAFYETTSN